MVFFGGRDLFLISLGSSGHFVEDGFGSFVMVYFGGRLLFLISLGSFGYFVEHHFYRSNLFGLVALHWFLLKRNLNLEPTATVATQLTFSKFSLVTSFI